MPVEILVRYLNILKSIKIVHKQNILLMTNSVVVVMTELVPSVTE